MLCGKPIIGDALKNGFHGQSKDSLPQIKGSQYHIKGSEQFRNKDTNLTWFNQHSPKVLPTELFKFFQHL